MLFLWFPFQKIQNPPDMITESQVREYLHEGICAFTYKKKDGTLRPAFGTLNTGILDMLVNRGVTSAGDERPPVHGYVIYYDVEKRGWRSCIANLILDACPLSEAIVRGTPIPEDVLAVWHEFNAGEVEDETIDIFANDDSLFGRIRRDYPCPKPEEGFTIGEAQWMFLVRNLLTGAPTLLTGPTGCGKTELVAFAAKRLGLPFRSPYDMGSMHDPLAQMLGTHRLAEGEKGTHSVFDYARFAREVQEPGVILLDELSRAPETTLNFLLPVLDGRRSLPVEAAGENDRRNIPVHPGCVFIATANIGQEYTGTRSLDPALQDRFVILPLDYLSIDDEATLLVNRCGIRDKQAKTISQAMSDIRALAMDRSIERSVSVRESLRVAELVRDGWDLQDALFLIVLPLYTGTDKEGDRAKVRRCIYGR